MMLIKKKFKINGNILFNDSFISIYKENHIFYYIIGKLFWIKQLPNYISFIFIDKNKYKQFLTQIFISINKFRHVFFYKLRMRGLGFRIIQIASGLFRFYFNKRNFFYWNVPNLLITRYKSKNIICLSYHLDMLKICINNLLALKKLSIYTSRGLFFPFQIRILKPGKKRF